MELSDFVTILALVLLEGLLSADNAMVLAVLVLGLPLALQAKALRYGILGAFAFRAGATVGATQVIELNWVQLLGGAYLLYLPYNHFRHAHRREDNAPRIPPPARPWMGLSAFWAISSLPFSSITSTTPEGASAATFSLAPASAGRGARSRALASARATVSWRDHMAT